MKTTAEVIAEGQRLQALNSLRGMPRGVPFGWSPEQWNEMVQKIVDHARASGVTDAELIAAGFKLKP